MGGYNPTPPDANDVGGSGTPPATREEADLNNTIGNENRARYGLSGYSGQSTAYLQYVVEQQKQQAQARLMEQRANQPGTKEWYQRQIEERQAQAAGNTVNNPSYAYKSDAQTMAEEAERRGDVLDPYVYVKARRDGYTGDIKSHGGNVGSLEESRSTVPMRTYGDDLPSTLPRNRQSATIDNIYVRYGYSQTEIKDGKIGFVDSGRFGIYQQDARGTWRLTSSGSDAALQSGGFSLRPLSPSIFTQESGGTKFASTARVDEANALLRNPRAYSRPGAEAYGGFVMPLDGRTIESSKAQLSTYSDPSNLANLVDPQAVNRPKSERVAMGDVPWGSAINASTPMIFRMDAGKMEEAKVPAAMAMLINLDARTKPSTPTVAPRRPFLSVNAPVQSSFSQAATPARVQPMDEYSITPENMQAKYSGTDSPEARTVEAGLQLYGGAFLDGIIGGTIALASGNRIQFTPVKDQNIRTGLGAPRGSAAFDIDYRKTVEEDYRKDLAAKNYDARVKDLNVDAASLLAASTSFEGEGKALTNKGTTLKSFIDRNSNIGGGIWVGSEQDYNKAKTMMADYNLAVESYETRTAKAKPQFDAYDAKVSKFKSDFAETEMLYGRIGEAEQRGLKSGTFVVRDGQVVTNPAVERPYGAWSDVSAMASSQMLGRLGFNAEQLEMEQVRRNSIPEVKANPSYGILGGFIANEQRKAVNLDNALFGASKEVLTNPGGVIMSAMSGAQMMALTMGAGGLFPRVAAPAASNALRLTGTVSPVARAMTVARPVASVGFPALVAGSFIWSATEGFTAPASKASMNVGQGGAHFAAMTMGAMVAPFASEASNMRVGIARTQERPGVIMGIRDVRTREAYALGMDTQLGQTISFSPEGGMPTIRTLYDRRPVARAAPRDISSGGYGGGYGGGGGFFPPPPSPQLPPGGTPSLIFRDTPQPSTQPRGLLTTSRPSGKYDGTLLGRVVSLPQSGWQDFVVMNPGAIKASKNVGMYSVSVARGQSRVDFITDADAGALSWSLKSNSVFGTGGKDQYFNPVEYDYIKSGNYPVAVNALSTGAARVRQFGGDGDYWTQVDFDSQPLGYKSSNDKMYITFKNLADFTPESAADFNRGLQGQRFKGSFKTPTDVQDAAGRFENIVLYENTPTDLKAGEFVARSIWGDKIQIGYGTDIVGRASSSQIEAAQMGHTQKMFMYEGTLPELGMPSILGTSPSPAPKSAPKFALASPLSGGDVAVMPMGNAFPGMGRINPVDTFRFLGTSIPPAKMLAPIGSDYSNPKLLPERTWTLENSNVIKAYAESPEPFRVGYTDEVDIGFKAIAIEMGAYGKPQRINTLQEFDAIKSEYPTLYRGVRGERRVVSFFNNAEPHATPGAHGSGTYAAYTIDLPKVYQNFAAKHNITYQAQNEFEGRNVAKDYGDNIIAMKLLPGAKVATMAEVYKITGEMQKKYPDNVMDVVGWNIGRTALVNGYDAVDIPDMGYMLILNKSKVAAIREPLITTPVRFPNSSWNTNSRGTRIFPMGDGKPAPLRLMGGSTPLRITAGKINIVAMIGNVQPIALLGVIKRTQEWEPMGEGLNPIPGIYARKDIYREGHDDYMRRLDKIPQEKLQKYVDRYHPGMDAKTFRKQEYYAGKAWQENEWGVIFHNADGRVLSEIKGNKNSVPGYDWHSNLVPAAIKKLKDNYPYASRASVDFGHTHPDYGRVITTPSHHKQSNKKTAGSDLLFDQNNDSYIRSYSVNGEQDLLKHPPKNLRRPPLLMGEEITVGAHGGFMSYRSPYIAGEGRVVKHYGGKGKDKTVVATTANENLWGEFNTDFVEFETLKTKVGWHGVGDWHKWHKPPVQLDYPTLGTTVNASETPWSGRARRATIYDQLQAEAFIAVANHPRYNMNAKFHKYQPPIPRIFRGGKQIEFTLADFQKEAAIKRYKEGKQIELLGIITKENPIAKETGLEQLFGKGDSSNVKGWDSFENIGTGAPTVPKPDSPIVTYDGITWDTSKSDFSEVNYWYQSKEPAYKKEYLAVLNWETPQQMRAKTYDIFANRGMSGVGFGHSLGRNPEVPQAQYRAVGRERFYGAMFDPENVETLKRLMTARENTFTPLTFYYDRFGSIGEPQEGRHRIQAMQELGVTQAPVWNVFQQDLGKPRIVGTEEAWIRTPASEGVMESWEQVTRNKVEERYFLSSASSAIMKSQRSYLPGQYPYNPVQNKQPVIKKYITTPEVKKESNWGETQFTHIKEHSILRGVIEDKSKIPDTLYHVTTNLPAVMDDGVLRHLPNVAGLGKGASVAHHGVSFTTSLEDAALIKTDLIRTIELSHGADYRVKLKEYIADDEIVAGHPIKAYDDVIEEYTFHEDIAKKEKYELKDTAIESLRYYRQRRDRLTEGKMQDPIIFGRSDVFSKVQAENVGVVFARKSSIPDDVVVRDPIGGFMHEIMVHADVPIAGAVKIPLPKYRKKTGTNAPEVPEPAWQTKTFHDVIADTMEETRKGQKNEIEVFFNARKGIPVASVMGDENSIPFTKWGKIFSVVARRGESIRDYVAIHTHQPGELNYPTSGDMFAASTHTVLTHGVASDSGVKLYRFIGDMDVARPIAQKYKDDIFDEFEPEERGHVNAWYKLRNTPNVITLDIPYRNKGGTNAPEVPEPAWAKKGVVNPKSITQLRDFAELNRAYSPSEFKAIFTYINPEASTGFDMNRIVHTQNNPEDAALLKGWGVPVKKIVHHIPAMDSAFEKQTMPAMKEGEFLFRGLNLEKVNQYQNRLPEASVGVGDKVVARGFVSTSLSPTAAMPYSQQWFELPDENTTYLPMLAAKVPEGTPIIYSENQKEVILPRGSSFTVTKKYPIGFEGLINKLTLEQRIIARPDGTRSYYHDLYGKSNFLMLEADYVAPKKGTKSLGTFSNDVPEPAWQAKTFRPFGQTGTSANPKVDTTLDRIGRSNLVQKPGIEHAFIVNLGTGKTAATVPGDIGTVSTKTVAGVLDTLPEGEYGVYHSHPKVSILDRVRQGFKLVKQGKLPFSKFVAKTPRAIKWSLEDRDFHERTIAYPSQSDIFVAQQFEVLDQKVGKSKGIARIMEEGVISPQGINIYKRGGKVLPLNEVYTPEVMQELNREDWYEPTDEELADGYKLIFRGRREAISPEADAKQRATMHAIGTGMKPGDPESFFVFQRNKGEIVKSGSGTSSTSISSRLITDAIFEIPMEQIADAGKPGFAVFHTHPLIKSYSTLDVKSLRPEARKYYDHVVSTLTYPSPGDIELIGDVPLAQEEGVISPGGFTAYRGMRIPGEGSARYDPIGIYDALEINRHSGDFRKFSIAMSRKGLDTQTGVFDETGIVDSKVHLAALAHWGSDRYFIRTTANRGKPINYESNFRPGITTKVGGEYKPFPLVGISDVYEMKSGNLVERVGGNLQDKKLVENILLHEISSEDWNGGGRRKDYADSAKRMARNAVSIWAGTTYNELLFNRAPHGEIVSVGAIFPNSIDFYTGKRTTHIQYVGSRLPGGGKEVALAAEARAVEVDNKTMELNPLDYDQTKAFWMGRGFDFKDSSHKTMIKFIEEDKWKNAPDVDTILYPRKLTVKKLANYEQRAPEVPEPDWMKAGTNAPKVPRKDAGTKSQQVIKKPETAIVPIIDLRPVVYLPGNNAVSTKPTYVDPFQRQQEISADGNNVWTKYWFGNNQDYAKRHDNVIVGDGVIFEPNRDTLMKYQRSRIGTDWSQFGNQPRIGSNVVAAAKRKQRPVVELDVRSELDLRLASYPIVSPRTRAQTAVAQRPKATTLVGQASKPRTITSSRLQRPLLVTPRTLPKQEIARIRRPTLTRPMLGDDITGFMQPELTRPVVPQVVQPRYQYPGQNLPGLPIIPPIGFPFGGSGSGGGGGGGRHGKVPFREVIPLRWQLW